MREPDIVRRGHGEGAWLLPPSVFAYKNGDVPLWVFSSWVRAVYELEVKYAIDERVTYRDGSSYTFRNKHPIVTARVDATYTREQRVQVLQALVDMLAVNNERNCVIAGGSQKLVRLLKPRRRDRK